MSVHKVQKEPTLLPVAIIHGQEFLIDVDNRQFRNLKNSDEVIEMHSQQGRKMVKDIQGSDWNSYGLSTGKINKAEM